ncbi:hypothetical protein [Nocardia mangyaensis]|uniref:hypothetical protein n=1 Tax=Nocardia mangyaensis TaxID=2213200 RepID=UPI002674C559|nr:hypothetical protein [Nocardia mangyaensis]MDO3650624.1 hypothetical protein [Nocardia mangyaensis]
MGVRLPATIRVAGTWSRRFAATTPGVIGLVLLVTALACLIAGSTAGQQLGAKIDRTEQVLTRTEPLAFAAQSLYVSLSAADAGAATAFLSGGIESPQVRDTYEQALAEAAAALAEATAGATDAETRTIVARIAADLPTYTGLVETARANNRQGYPVGSAYLRQASDLMQTSLLPHAEQLTEARFAAVGKDQRDIGALPWTTIVGLLLVLAVCGTGSVLLLRRTNRLVNVGIALAAGATLLALLWTVGATVAAAQLLDTGRTGAGARVENLAGARILAQQARTDETLALITRGDITAPEAAFGTHIGELEQRLLAAGIADSETGRTLARWTAGHNAQRTAYEKADYPGAVSQAIGTGPESSATSFTRLDQELRDALAHARDDLRDGVDAAGNALILSPFGVLVLLLGAAGAVVTGLWPRLKEFL